MNYELIRTRIAPSPTGDWHLGTARTALFAYLFARQNQGKFFLRIEDTDQNRLVQGADNRIIEVMDWLGLDTDRFDDQPFLRQSERLTLYQDTAEALVKNGQAYYCFATPEELQAMRDEQSAQKQPPRYDNRWGYRDLPVEEAKAMASTKPYVIRFKMPQSGTIELDDAVHGHVRVDATTLDDHVLLKADGFPTYHLAHIVDDHDTEITHVIRGDEWLPSAPRHVALIDALGYKRPTYVHLPVILGPDKGKLSKRHGAKTVLEYRDAGYLPEAVKNYLLLLGWAPSDNRELFNESEMQEVFSLERLQKSPAKFNADKLDWFNAEYLRQLNLEELKSRLITFYADDSVWKGRIQSGDTVIELIRDRLKTLADYAPLASVFYERPDSYVAEKLPSRGQTVNSARSMLERSVTSLETVMWDRATLKLTLDGLVEKQGVKVGEVYLPLRYALTGLEASPGALECLIILGKEESLARIRACLSSVA